MKLPNLPIPMNFLKTAKFSRREKYSILAVSGLIFCIAFFQLVVSPIIEKRDRLARNISVKTRVLEDIIALSQEYKAVKKWADFSKERIIKRDKNFSLFSFLDHLADKAKIKKNITYMKPSTKAKKDSAFKTSKVEMKIKDLSLNQIITYLHMVEGSKNRVFIRKLSLSKSSRKGEQINATMLVETFVL